MMVIKLKHENKRNLKLKYILSKILKVISRYLRLQLYLPLLLAIFGHGATLMTAPHTNCRHAINYQNVRLFSRGQHEPALAHGCRLSER